MNMQFFTLLKCLGLEFFVVSERFQILGWVREKEGKDVKLCRSRLNIFEVFTTLHS